MFRWTPSLILAVVLPIAIITILTSIAVSCEGADREIWGDWVVTDGVTHVSNETIDVRGNVIIREGGHLRLDDCTLRINGTRDGEYGLEVNRTGQLEAYRTEILGSPGRIVVRIYNETLLQGCTLDHIHSNTQVSGVVLYDGDITIRDTLIKDANWSCLEVHTDLTMVNVTLMDVEYRQMYILNTLASDEFSVSMDACTFDGNAFGVGRTRFGVQVAVYTGYEDVTIFVANSTFEMFTTGMSISCYEGLTFTAEGCEMVNCWTGFGIYQTASTVVLRRNLLRQASITVKAGGTIDLRIEDNVIEQGVLIFEAVWAGSYECTVENVTLRNCTEGVRATGSAGGGTIGISIRNSSLESVDTGFIAGQGARISIHDTGHIPGSGRAIGTGSWVRGYVTLDIREVRWRGGPGIEDGGLHLKDRDGVTQTVFDMGALVPREFLGWERSDASSFTHVFLEPAIMIDGHWFPGERYIIWLTGPTVIEIIDDVPPIVAIAFPLNATGVNSSSPLARGEYEDLGSGLAYLQYTIDNGTFATFTTFDGGRWNLTLPSLTDGDHNLTVRGFDAGGNVGNVTSVGFVVDTMMPMLDIPPPPGLVNRTHLMLVGRTEPGAHLTVDGSWVPLEPDGSFTIGLLLEEGPNELVITVMDWAGNTNGITFHIACDTIIPSLDVTSPSDLTWVNTTWTDVEGTFEPGATLTVMGEDVQGTGGTFIHRVDLVEGQLTINITARDAAGNRATAVIVLFVDWTAPELTINQPEGDVIVTRDLVIWIYGEVDDPMIGNVTINGKVVDTFASGFSKLCTLLEGSNEYVIWATDAAGNAASTTVVIIRDLTPPTYEVVLDPVGGEFLKISGKLYSTAPTVEFHVTTDEPAAIIHPDGSARPLAEDHRWTQELVEGLNVLRFVVEDLAGNRGTSYAEDVLLDTTAPMIVVYEPLPGSITEKDRVFVHGRSEEGTVVRVAGTPVDVDSDGQFRRFVDLVVGPNEISIEVSDPMGNINGTHVSIERVEDTEGEGGLGLLWTVTAIVVVILVLALIGILAATRMRRRGPGMDRGGEDLPDRPEGPPPAEGTSPEAEVDSRSDWEEY